MNQKLLALGVVFLSVMAPLKAQAVNFTGLNIFGDSLVDTGNLFNLTGSPPSPPYAQKFSNGPLWIDNLANELSLTPALSTDVLPGVLTGAILPPSQGINFAFGGALTSDLNVGSPLLPGLQQQIETFTDLTTVAPADSSALYVLWAGGNDYNEVFFNPNSLTVPLPALPHQTTSNISAAVQTLIDVGAKDFLVVNLPSLGGTPFADLLDQQIDPSISNQLNDLTAEHNLLLEQKLDQLRGLPDVNITTFDVNSLLAEVVANPDQFGFTNVDDPCLINFMPGFRFDGVCENPDEFLYWDDNHPTARAGEIIAQAASDTLGLQTVPEPASGLGLLALGALGAGSRAKRQSPSRTSRG